MIREFKCKNCNKTIEVLFVGMDDSERVKEFCSQNNCKCGENLFLVDFSVTAYPLSFFGNPEGYHKPAPSKRHSTKTITKKGNYK